MKNHHKHYPAYGTADDPDLKNYKSYPVSSASFFRKVARDLTGKIGLRRLKSIAWSFLNLKTLSKRKKQVLIRSLLCNFLLLLILGVFGSTWLYLLWILAFMTSHMCISRIRQVGEHAAVPSNMSDDPRLNTRTIYVNIFEKILVVPHDLNYHLEHHLFSTAPIYRLKTLHNLLLSKGYYEGVKFTKGYMNLYRQVVINEN